MNSRLNSLTTLGCNEAILPSVKDKQERGIGFMAEKESCE